jgi:hypothetical protein
MEVLNIDTVGPLPADSDGYQYVFVIVDCFSRWVEMYPMKSTNASETGVALLQHVGRYGIPKSLRSDHGSQFVNETVGEFVKAIGAEQDISIPYSHESNAIVERANKEVMRHLRAILHDKRHNQEWKENLPMVQRIMNASIHRSTGVRPSEILFGQSVDLDRSILTQFSKPEQKKFSQWMFEKLQAQEAIIKNAQQTLERTNSKYVEKKDKRGNKSKLSTTKGVIKDILLDPLFWWHQWVMEVTCDLRLKLILYSKDRSKLSE